MLRIGLQLVKKFKKMARKLRILGLEFEWFDVKTKFKQLLRKLVYTKLVQDFICLLLSGYIRLVFLTSRVRYVNRAAVKPLMENGTPIIYCAWHNRLMMMPLLITNMKKSYAKNRKNFFIYSLVSKHGDGRFVGRTTEFFGHKTISGSTRDNRKSSRGIDIGGLRQILSALKKGNSLCFTPDGPRGPNQKINGELINIARLTGAAIWPISYSSSRFITLNSWDKFKIPLPFGQLSLCCEPDFIFVPKQADEVEMEKIKLDLEERLNLIQRKSLEIAMNK